MANQYERAYRAWPILAACARNGSTLTYKQLAKKISIHHRTVRFVLGKIQDYCLLEKLPPLTILVVNQFTQRPSQGFIAWDTNNIPEGQEKVFKYSWDALPNPFGFAADGTSIKELAELLVEKPSIAKEVYAKVKVRGVAQEIFRVSLLKVYQHKCAFTDISFPICLDAAHLIRWAESTPAQRLDVRNGILMSNFHHRLFDQKLITVDEEYRIRFCNPDMISCAYSELDKALTVNLNGREMRLPTKRESWPKVEWIKQRNEKLNLKFF